MPIITCPKCHIDGEYHYRNNFDTYKCDCGCIFYRANNNTYLIGRNPFQGYVITITHHPNCPGCHHECTCDTVCDNSCGTFMCDCGHEFHIVNEKCVSGHNPQCGTE